MLAEELAVTKDELARRKESFMRKEVRYQQEIVDLKESLDEALGGPPPANRSPLLAGRLLATRPPSTTVPDAARAASPRRRPAGVLSPWPVRARRKPDAGAADAPDPEDPRAHPGEDH